MQYSAMDQTLDSINELCLCSRRSLIHEICSYDISRVEKRYFVLPRSAYYDFCVPLHMYAHTSFYGSAFIHGDYIIHICHMDRE